MRPLLVALVLVLAAFVSLAPASTGEQCGSSSGCEFWDNDYHEYILHAWDTAQLNVLIVPPATPNGAVSLDAIEKSIDAWETAIQAEADPWLANEFEIERYTLGRDTVPPEVLADWEILVVSAEYNPYLLLGIGLHIPGMACTDLPGGHSHDQSSWTVMAEQCDRGGIRCMVVNTNFLNGGKRRMYDLNSHEFGHCLGIGHVGDALDFDAKTFPEDDIMSYQYDPSHVHCVSSLNMQGIHGVYAEVLGRPSSTWLDSGDYTQMATSSYSQVSCANP
jgi:hypothetical protein